MLVDYVQRELADGSRTVSKPNTGWWWCSYWAAWPFETLLLPKQNACPAHYRFKRDERATLALVGVEKLTSRYDNPFPVFLPLLNGAGNLARRLTVKKTHTGSCTRTYPPLLRLRPSVNLWSAMKCWRKPSVILTAEQRLNACARSATSISRIRSIKNESEKRKTRAVCWKFRLPCHPRLQAPCRVNLTKHTDYNDGFVPALALSITRP